MAPVAPSRANVEQDGLVLCLRAGKCFRAPFVPIHLLMHGGAQIRTRGSGETAFRFFVHNIPSRGPLRGKLFLLNRMLRTGVLRVDRFATGKSFILAMIETDAVFSKSPAQIHFFIFYK